MNFIFILINMFQDKVKEYEKEMDRLRDLIGVESEKENEIEALRERNRQLALNLRDSQSELEGSGRGLFLILLLLKVIISIICYVLILNILRINGHFKKFLKMKL